MAEVFTEQADFLAVDDDGKEYVVTIFREYTHHRSLSGDLSRKGGRTYFELADGTEVIHRDADLYEIKGTGKLIRKVR